jgi:hypothetical protein
MEFKVEGSKLLEIMSLAIINMSEALKYEVRGQLVTRHLLPISCYREI